MPIELKADTFADRCGEKFTLTHADVDDFQMEVELVGVERLPTPAVNDPDIRSDPFSLEFQGPEEPILPQSLYTFAHDQLGEQLLFVVPVGPKDGRQRYQVIIN